MARKKITFENAMETLEEIVNQLEAGDIPLNELIDKYNEGMKLSNFCLDELNKAKDAIYTEVDIKDNKITEKKLNVEGDY
ncbi:exodeoxyribonuclease VII small subunit [uncultured Megamonas sp.]|uniref:exodeoxyribonuclease VII small subunit n=1 Tax=uncultured Megamonas sp. TaxID=286140 RepID=UPI0025F379D3|nr:exodeoxyribonuclease VII small subunit [uncultured Megamonas sp.]